MQQVGGQGCQHLNTATAFVSMESPSNPDTHDVMGLTWAPTQQTGLSTKGKHKLTLGKCNFVQNAALVPQSEYFHLEPIYTSMETEGQMKWSIQKLLVKAFMDSCNSDIG